MMRSSRGRCRLQRFATIRGHIEEHFGGSAFAQCSEHGRVTKHNLGLAHVYVIEVHTCMMQSRSGTMLCNIGSEEEGCSTHHQIPSFEQSRRM